MCNNNNRCGNDLKFLLEQPEVLTYMSDTLATVFQNGALYVRSVHFPIITIVL